MVNHFINNTLNKFIPVIFLLFWISFSSSQQELILNDDVKKELSNDELFEFDNINYQIKQANHDTTKAPLLMQLVNVSGKLPLKRFFSYYAKKELGNFVEHNQVLSEKEILTQYLIKSYCAIGLVNHYEGDYDSSFYYNRKALDYSKSINYQLGESEAYNNIGVTFMSLGEIDSSFLYFDSSLKLKIEINHEIGIINLLYNKATVLERIGAVDKAEESLLKGIELSKEINDSTLLAKGYNNLSYLFEKLGKNNEALDLLLETARIKESRKDIIGLINTHNNIFAIYSSKKDLKNAIIHLMKARELASNNNLVNINLVLESNLGAVYLENNFIEYALIHFKNALKLSKQYGLADNIAHAYQNIGYSYYHLKDTTEALKNFDQSLHYYTKSKNKSGQAFIQVLILSLNYTKANAQKTIESIKAQLLIFENTKSGFDILNTNLFLAEIYYDLSNYEKAKEHALIAYSASQNSLDILLETDCAQLLYKISKEQGELSNAIEYNENYILLKDSIAKMGNDVLVAKTLIDAETEKAELIAENERKEKELALTNSSFKSKLLYLVSIISLLAISLLYFIVRKRKAESVLYHKSKELDDLKYQAKIEDKNNEIRQLINSINSKEQTLNELMNSEDYKESQSEKLLLKIKDSKNQNTEWENIFNVFDNLYPNYISNFNLKAEKDLTFNETKLLVLIRLGYSSKEIANTLFVSIHAVNKARQRLNKKID